MTAWPWSITGAQCEALDLTESKRVAPDEKAGMYRYYSAIPAHRLAVPRRM